MCRAHRIVLGISTALFVPVLLAQQSTGTISGEITDVTGAVVPAANVIVTNVNTGVTQKSETNSVGIYVFEYLPPGDYQIDASKPGFEAVLRKGIALLVNQRARQDIVMQVGSAAQSVQVVDQAEQALKPASAELGETITSNSIQELPLNGRNYLKLVTLTAGVAPGPPGVFNNLMGGLNFSVEGLRENSSSYMIEGFDNNYSNINAPFNVLPADAIQEFALLTNNFSAEYGRSAGGVVSAVLRSGTNGFHGTAFEFLRNDKLDANNFFANKSGAPKNPLRFNQFGGSLGGPIIHNKTFFFADYQGTRNVSKGTVIASVPIAAARAGDFSYLLPQGGIIYDPNSTPGPSTGRTPFAGNTIPLSQQDPAVRKLLALYPLPNLQGIYNNYVGVNVLSAPSNQADLKVDENFSTKDRLTVRYDINDNSIINPPVLGPVAEGGGGNTYVRTQQVSGIYTRILSASLINEFRVAYMRHWEYDVTYGYGKNLDNEVGIPGINTNPNNAGLAWTCFGTYSCLGDTQGWPIIITPSTSLQFGDNLSLTRGRHSIKVGLSLMPRRLNLLQPFYPFGVFSFDALFTSKNGVGGDPVATGLTGYFSSGMRDILDHYMDIHDMEAGAFVQDNFRINRKLTLNLGLRWDVFTPQTEAKNRQANFDPATGTMRVAGQNGNSEALVNTDWKDFQPRFGFAYSVTERTVVRGGYGISFVPERDSVAQNRISYNPPFYFSQNYTQSGLSAPTRAISQGLPTPSTPDPLHPAGNVQYQQPNMGNAYIQYWNLDVQRALTNTLVLDAAYAANKGTHLLTMTSLNQPLPAPVRVFPYPALGNINSFFGVGNSSYNSLQLKAEKRFSAGVAFRAAYTWAKAIDNSPGFWPVNTGARIPQNTYNLKAERSLSANDIAHRFVLNYDWELPVGHGKALLGNAGRMVDGIAGGWQLTGIFIAQSGLPFTPTTSVNRANTVYGGAARPDRLCSGNLSSASVNRWFDPGCFALPALYTFGNSGRNILIGPKFVNFDFGLFKNFRLTETLKLQFRGEFFNGLNHPNFATPLTAIDVSTAGVITAQSAPPRQIQFALKLLF
jgi:hypothetical protein